MEVENLLVFARKWVPSFLGTFSLFIVRNHYKLFNFCIVNIFMEKIVFTWNSERIDVWLTRQFIYSRNFFHHIISRWGILIEGKPVKKSYKLKEWDVVEIDDLKRYLSSVVLAEAPNFEIPIVLEKEDYLVINKPKWVLSHPNSVWDVERPSVVGFLYHRYKNLPGIDNFIRAGLIHRLDKDTDGLMLIAKTEKWLAYFKSLFNQKSECETIEEKEQIPLKKFYRATCEISVLGDSFLAKIENKLPYIIQENVTPKTPNPITKEGITKILSFQRDGDLVHIKLEILTGRTHQIRCHLSNHGLSILGDYLYWVEWKDPMSLTAFCLEFKDVEWEKIALFI